MKRHCFTLDLYDDPELIKGYEDWHQQVWPEIIDSIKASGIINMQIYRAGNRLFMVMDVNEDFSFELKASMDEDNQRVQEWETLMWQFQKPLSFANPGEKWVLMHEIFSLK